SHPSFFFLLLPRPPLSTLFPYTTLFRSLQLRPGPGGAGGARRRPAFHRRGRQHRRRAGRQGEGLPAHQGLARGGAEEGGEAGRRDRKSTRLNSSHSQISYAVFCLKKKKK